MNAVYRIRCENNDWDDKPQYWNNKFGWTCYFEADTYSQEEKDEIDANNRMCLEGYWVDVWGFRV